jgi:hypothetical protein
MHVIACADPPGKKRKLNGRGKLGQEKSTTKLNGMESLFQLKQQRETNKILQGHVPRQAGAGRSNPPQMDGDARQRGTITDGRTLPRELLDNGQGKSVSLDMEISNSSKGEAPPLSMVHYSNNCNGTPQHLLLPPVIEATGSIAMGVTTNILRKQNKHHRMEALLWQPVATNGSHTRATIFYHGTTGKAATRHLTSLRWPPRVWLCSTRQQPC